MAANTFSYILNPSHWANQNLVSFWSSLPGMGNALSWYDLNRKHDWTINVGTGTGGPIPWGKVVRPGSLGDSSLGTFNNSTAWFGSSDIGISAVCPNGGTISFWLYNTIVYSDAGDQLILIQWPTPGTWPQFLLLRSGGSLYGGYSWNATEYRAILTLSASNCPINQWTHYTLTWQIGQKGVWYVNGVQAAVAANTLVTPTYPTGATLKLGGDSAWSGTHYLKEYIDDLNIWSSVANSQQAAQIYNESLAGWTSRLSLPSLANQIYFQYPLPPVQVYLNATGATATVGAYTGSWPISIDTTAATASSTVGGESANVSVDTSALAASGVSGTTNTCGGLVDPTYRVNRTISPDHWANNKLSAWWLCLPEMIGGMEWPDLTGKYPVSIGWSARSGNTRSPGPWAPSADSSGAFNPRQRPGGNGRAFGPLNWTDGGSTINMVSMFKETINNLCPTSGTISFWQTPSISDTTLGVNYDTIIQMASIGGGTPSFWFMFAKTNLSEVGFLTGSEYRINWHVSSSDYAIGVWHHWTVTFAAGDYTRLYLDGKPYLTASTPNPTPLPTVTGTSFNVYAGYSAIDDLNFWSYQMPANQVSQVYSESSQGWPGRLTGWSSSSFNPVPYYAVTTTTPVSINVSAVSSDCIYGGSSETLTSPFASVASDSILGSCTANLNVDTTSVLSTADAGTMHGSWAIDINLAGCTADATVGGCSESLGMLVSAVSSDSVDGSIQLETDYNFSAQSASSAVANCTSNISTDQIAVESDATTGSVTTAGGIIAYANLFTGYLNPHHWANQRLAAYWTTLKGLEYAPFWPDLTCNNNFSLANVSGSDSHFGGTWTQAVSPASQGNAVVGPFAWASTNKYFSSAANINTLCPNAGTVAFWLLPLASYGSFGSEYILCQGDMNLGPLFAFNIQGGGQFNAGFLVTGANSQASIAFGSFWFPYKWIHIAFTFASGSFTKLYINGRLMATGGNANQTPLTTVASPYLTLGTGWNGSSFYGSENVVALDDLSIWSIEMKANQIDQVYNESLGGWKNRFANWQAPDRFGIAPYFAGPHVDLISVLSFGVAGTTNLKTDTFESAPGSDVFPGADSESIVPALPAGVVVSGTGSSYARLDISYSAVVSTCDVGNFVPPGTAYFTVNSVSSLVSTGGSTEEIDISYAAVSSSIDLGASAGSWNTTFVGVSATGADSNVGFTSLNTDIFLRALTSSVRLGSFTIYLGSMVPLIAVWSGVDTATSIQTEVKVARLSAVKVSITFAGNKAGPNPWLNGLSTQITTSSTDTTVKIPTHGLRVLSPVGTNYSGPFIALAAQTASIDVGDEDETVGVRSRSVSSLAKLGAERAAIVFPLSSLEADASAGAVSGVPTLRTRAVTASVKFGSSSTSLVAPESAVANTVVIGGQDQDAVMVLRSSVSRALSGHLTSTLSTDLTTVSGSISPASVSSTVAPQVRAAIASSFAAHDRTNVTAGLTSVASDISQSAIETAFSPSLHGVTSTALVGGNRRSVSVDVVAYQLTVDVGGSTSTSTIRCIGGQAIASPGHRTSYSDPISLNVAGQHSNVILGSMATAIVTRTHAAWTSGNAGNSILRTTISLVSTAGVISPASQSAGPRIQVPAARVDAPLGEMLVSSPPVEIDVSVPSAGVSVGGPTSSAVMPVSGLATSGLPGSLGTLATLLIAGVPVVASDGFLLPTIEPYAYPDPFQGVGTEWVDPFESDGSPRG